MKEKVLKRLKRHKRIRQKLSGHTERPRLCVFRSNKHIYLQLIADDNNKVLLAVSDKEIASHDKLKKVDLAFKLGELIAEKSLAKKIDAVVFDRAGYKYHGRVKAAAEGARKGGLKF